MRAKDLQFYVAAFFAVLFLGVGGQSARSEGVPAGTVLTISGATGTGDPVHLDMAAIKALPAVTFETFDPWDNRDRTYTGPRLIDVLALADVSESAGIAEIRASDGYRIPVRMPDLERLGHILSYQMDGESYAGHAGSERKGKLAIAIDFTDREEEMIVFKHHLVWWVKSIVVE